jgi:hypothetical protein
MITFKHLFEKVSLPVIKSAIKKAVKEDPARLGHGHTGRTTFWILSDGEILPWSAWKKEWKRIIADKNAISFHSHSSASGKDDQGFETFSGGDIQSLRGGYHDQIGLISAQGQLHILQGGKWKKSDERYDADNDWTADEKLDALKALAKSRGGQLITTTWK